MRNTYDHEYPPGKWTVAEIEAALESTPASFAIPTYAEADVWASLQNDELTSQFAESIVAAARDAQDEPLPSLRASAYLNFDRTGERYVYQDPMQVRLNRLTRFTLAECFEREGEFLDDVLDYAWALCEQTTWVSPAHLNGAHGFDGLARVSAAADERVVALHSTWIGELLAEVDYLLGDRLHPALRARIRTEIDRRIVAPYLARDDIWWRSPPAMNWNAVCNSSVAIAALHALDDVKRQARVVATAVDSLEHYLANFDPDGCTAEGLIYWNYGVSHYIHLAVALAARTDGALSLCSPPIMQKIATYPIRIELSPGHYVPFSDSTEECALSPGVTSWLGTRFEIEGLAALGRRLLDEHGPGVEAPSSMAALRDLLWARDVPADWEQTPGTKRTFFAGHDWWIARTDPDDPDGLVVAAKGGHNDEPHNHNDCGSFLVHYRGESLLTDLGRPTYDREYFENEHRYDYLAARSLGHSVPHVNGCEQRFGVERTATVVERAAGPDRESITVDIGDCYPAEAGLESLERTVALDRGEPGRVTVHDRSVFEPETEGAVESVLVSYFPMTVADGRLVVSGEQACAKVTPQFRDGDSSIDIERLPDAIEGRDVWRARIAPDAGDANEGTGTPDPSVVYLSLTVDVAPK